MSSKGQIVIPEDIRTRLHLKPGSRFIVLGDDDVVILKTISPPAIKEFDGLINKVRKQAQNAMMKETDILEAVKEVRGNV